MRLKDTPWLANNWNSSSFCKNFSPTVTQPLWLSNDQRSLDTESLEEEKKPQSPGDQGVRIVPDSGMYGTFYVDFGGKDMRQFSVPAGPSLNNCVPLNNAKALDTETPTLPWKPAFPPQPHLESWDKKRVKGTGRSMMKTFCSPKLPPRAVGLQLVDVLPPAPPRPREEQEPRAERMMEGSNRPKNLPEKSPEVRRRDGLWSARGDGETSARYSRLSSVSVSVSGGDENESVLTWERALRSLELAREESHPRHFTDTLTLRRPSSRPLTYGYICGPTLSDLEADFAAAEDEEEDDEDNEMARGRPRLLLRGLCRAPGSSESGGSSEAGSLANGWGSEYEDPGTSARCSLVSSDASFLMDANFAQALAVAVDSFCFGLRKTEPRNTCSDLSAASSRPGSILDSALSHEPSEGSEVTGRFPEPEMEPGWIWEWNPSWAGQLRDRGPPRGEAMARNPTPVPTNPEGTGRLPDEHHRRGRYIADVYGCERDRQAESWVGGPQVSVAPVRVPGARREPERAGAGTFPTDPSAVTVAKV
eukprot:gi/632956968/ref/XP_007894225.1/ PREDICTED: roundabout homolog 4-like [Callorhinchus milii]